MKSKISEIYKLFFQKKTIIIGIIICILLLYKEFFEQLLNNYFVEPIFSKIDSNKIITDVIFTLVIIVVSIYFFNKFFKNYILSTYHYSIIFLISSAYIYYRLDQNVWYFYEFGYAPILKYADLIVWIFILCTFIFIRNKFFKLPDETSNKNGFILDEPIGNNRKNEKNNELLGYTRYAEKLTEKIELTENKYSAFAVGIVGSWGTGKTSFLNLIKNNISPNSIILDFNPWYSSNSKSISERFFENLIDHLSQYSSSLTKRLSDYTEKVTAVDQKYSSLNSIFNLFHNDESIEEQYEKVNDAIRQINRKIYIFIDDIDRLDKREVNEVIRIIRNTANFSNTIFIVAYDRNYVINAVKDLNDYNNEFYLEKIFQLELTLPHFEYRLITRRLSELLKEKLDIKYHQKIDSFLSQSSFYNKKLDYAYITNIRDVTRFINNFTLSFEKLKGEVVFEDLFNIELIKLKYPAVFELLFKRRQEFMDTKGSTHEKHTLILKHNKDKNINDLPNPWLQDFLNKNYKDFSIPESHIPKIIDSLNVIFPFQYYHSYQNEEGKLSIVYPTNYNRYFGYRLFEGDLSEVEFSKYRMKSQEEFNSQIEKWVKRCYRPQLKDKFREIHFYNDREDFEKVISAIFFFGRLPQVADCPSDYFTGYEDEDLRSKLYDGNDDDDKDWRITNKFYDGVKIRFYNFIKDLFDKAPSPYLFESSFARSIIKYNYNFIIPIKELEDIQVNYLKKYILSSGKLDETTWALFYNCKTVEQIPVSGGHQYFQHQNPKSIESFKGLIKEDLDNFLFQIISLEHFEEKKLTINDAIKTIFGSFENFEEFINELSPEGSEYLDEFKVFLEKFKENNFAGYIDFNFNIIPIEKKKRKTSSKTGRTE